MSLSVVYHGWWAQRTNERGSRGRLVNWRVAGRARERALLGFGVGDDEMQRAGRYDVVGGSRSGPNRISGQRAGIAEASCGTSKHLQRDWALEAVLPIR